MSALTVIFAAVLGVLLAPVQRALIFRYSVPYPPDPEDPADRFDAPAELTEPAEPAELTELAEPAEPAWRHACPHCGAVLLPDGWRSAVSALPPSGRCQTCHRRIGPPPGLVEVVSAVVFALLAARVSQPLPLAAFFWVAGLGIVLCFVDLAVSRLPDALTLTAFGGALVLLGVAALVVGNLALVGWAALGGLAMAAAYLILVLVYPSGMFLGDVKLALSLGTILGWYGWVFVVFGAAAGSLVGGVVAFFGLLTGRLRRKDTIPYGPSMLVGAFALIMILG